MRISAHILPRRVILALLLGLGWALRFWGLSWGPDPTHSGHPEEWTWQIIDSLSFASPTYPGIWTQAFYSLAALARGAISTCAGWLGVWLGEVRTSTELVLPAQLAGRATAAFLGGAQVWAAYMVARRYFDSVATGLLAAALVAVHPVLVTQSHYLALDTPLALAVMFCLWAAWRLLQKPGPGSLALAGLALGLTLTTKASGVLVAPALAAAAVLAWRRERPEVWPAAVSWPLGFLVGLLGGLLLGYPGFLVRLPEVGDVIQASFSLSGQASADGLGHMADRLTQISVMLGPGVAWVLAGLWLLAGGLMLWRRNWSRLVLLIFPPLYLCSSLVLLRGAVEGQVAVWLPVAIMVACWPVVVACRRLPGEWLPVSGALLAGFLLCLPLLWRSLEAGYLFWQQDTFNTASFWLRANLPPGAEVLASGQTPAGLFPSQRRLGEAGSGRDWPRENAYLLTTTLGPDGEPCALEPGADLRAWQLLQAFDLRAGLGREVQRPPCLPRWVSPRVEVRAPFPARGIDQPLALWRPAVGAERGYALIPGQHNDYSRAENCMWLTRPGLAQRTLRLDQAPARLGLDLHNAGEDLALVRVSQGPGSSQPLTIYPGQSLHLPLTPRAWPPMATGFFPVRVVASRGGGIMARLEWDPLLLGRQALEEGAFAQAEELLAQAEREHPRSFEARALRAGALARLGRYQEAGGLLARLAEAGGEPARTYQALAQAGAADGDTGWVKSFEDFSGYHYPLLRQALGLEYPVRGALWLAEEPEAPLQGQGFHGSLTRPTGKAGGSLRLWLDQPFPAGRFLAELRLSTRGLGSFGEPATAEIWVRDAQGGRRLVARPLKATDLVGGTGRVTLPLDLTQAANRLEVRLNFQSPGELRLESLRLGVDLPAHMRQVLRWYHDAGGRVALQAGRHAAAVAAFEALLALDPEFGQAHLLLAQALIDAGRLEPAYRQVRQAEQTHQAQPARLAQVRDLYAMLLREEDVARVERGMADLRPSLRREARFASGLSLLGYDLSSAEVRPGGSLDLGYYWRVWAKPPLNYYIFVHLKGPDEILTFDHLLDHGRRDMTGLKLGEVARENYRITIPPRARPGRYRLLVGMWDPRFTGQRVPVVEGEGAGGDEVLLTTIEVR